MLPEQVPSTARFGLNKKTAVLRGGYDCAYSVNPGFSTIHGKITIGGPSSGTGSVTLERIIIQ